MGRKGEGKWRGSLRFERATHAHLPSHKMHPKQHNSGVGKSYEMGMMLAEVHSNG